VRAPAPCRLEHPRFSSSTGPTCRSTSRRFGARWHCSTRTFARRWTSSTAFSTSRAGPISLRRKIAIGLVNRVIRVPRVILLIAYDRIPRRYVRFSRFNIYRATGTAVSTAQGLRTLRAESRSRGTTLEGRHVDRGERRVLVSSLHRLKGGRNPSEAACGSFGRPGAASGRRSWPRRSACVATRSGCLS